MDHSTHPLMHYLYIEEVGVYPCVTDYRPVLKWRKIARVPPLLPTNLFHYFNEVNPGRKFSKTSFPGLFKTKKLNCNLFKTLALGSILRVVNGGSDKCLHLPICKQKAISSQQRKEAEKHCTYLPGIYISSI